MIPESKMSCATYEHDDISQRYALADEESVVQEMVIENLQNLLDVLLRLGSSLPADKHERKRRKRNTAYRSVEGSIAEDGVQPGIVRQLDLVVGKLDPLIDD